jgi:integrase/recombinase XerD
MAENGTLRPPIFGIFPVVSRARRRSRRVRIEADSRLIELWLAGRPDSTRRVYRAEAQAFLASLPGGLGDASAADVLLYMESVTGAPATRARRISTLKSLLAFAGKLGATPTNLGTVLRVPRVTGRLHERLLEVGEVEAMIKEATSARDRALIRLLYLSGFRIAEAVGIRWIDVRLTAITVVGKGARARTVAVPAEVTNELRALRGPRESETARVFKSVKGTPLSIRQARRVVSNAALEAIGRPASPHWLRHAHATVALEHGCPLHVLRDSLGHSSIATTSRYLTVRPGMGSAEYVAERAQRSA